MRKPRWWPKIVFSVAVVGAASTLCIWSAYYHEPMPRELEQGVRRIVKLNTKLQPMLDKALADGVLTIAEGNAIVDEAQKHPIEPE